MPFFFFNKGKQVLQTKAHPHAPCKIQANVQLFTALEVEYFCSDHKGANSSQVIEQGFSPSALIY